MEWPDDGIQVNELDCGFAVCTSAGVHVGGPVRQQIAHVSQIRAALVDVLRLGMQHSEDLLLPDAQTQALQQQPD